MIRAAVALVVAAICAFGGGAFAFGFFWVYHGIVTQNPLTAILGALVSAAGVQVLHIGRDLSQQSTLPALINDRRREQR